MASYNISSYSDLKTVKDDLAGDYTVTANIDCSDSRYENWNATYSVYEGFPPIGDSVTPFTGTFDGGGYTISNLYQKSVVGSVVAFGMFGQVDISGGNEIKNFNITNMEIDLTDAAKSFVGLLVGIIYGLNGDHALVDNVNVQGIIKNGSYTGGLVGTAQLTDFTDCISNVASTLTNYSFIGGFVAVVRSSTFTDCISRGSISIAESGGGNGFIGGFVGWIAQYIAVNPNEFTSCKSEMSIVSNRTGTPSATHSIGGFLGYSQSGAGGSFSLCGADVAIFESGTNLGVFGGFCSISGSVITPSECYAVGTIEAPNVTRLCGVSDGEIGGFSCSVAAQNCYARVDICSLGIALDSVRLGGFTASSTGTVNCYSTGYVYPIDNATYTDSWYGGFIGYRGVAGTIADCFWDTETSETTQGVGSGITTNVTGKTTDEMKTSSTFTNWDFDTIWVIPEYTQVATPQRNLTIWFSRTNDYHNFDEGLKDDDAFTVALPTTNEIRWMKGLESLIVGTSAGEWKIASNKLDTPLTPTAFSAKRQTTYGSAKINALAVNSSVLFVDFVRRKLREVTFNPQEEKYVAPDMTELAEHVTASGIVDIAHQKNPDSIVWCVLTDGTLISMVYDRDQDVVAWSTHPTDGTVLSVCVVPDTDEDYVWITVARDNGTFIERFMPRVFGTDYADAFCVDSGITDTSGGTTISGLTHLQGQDVIVLGDGVQQTEETSGDFTVTAGGQITVPSGLSKLQIGLPYTWKVQPMRIVLASGEGTSFGSITRVSEIVVSFLNTLGATYGSNASDLYSIDFTDTRWEDEAYITGLFSGDVVVSMPGGFSVNNPIILSGSGPYPATIRTLIARISKTGR